MTTIKTSTKGQVTIDFNQEVYEKFQNKYGDLIGFIDQLKAFNADLANNHKLYNINP